ncbi:MAG TPA: AI-2E family transporter, partial [Cytophagales bacterium]|nr:AI-2E family transporter [Cytophagales bacterium]
MSKLLNNTLLVISFVFIAYVLKPVIIPVIFSVILAVSVYPLVFHLEIKLKLNKQLAAILGVLFITSIAILVITFIAYQLADVLSKFDIYMNRLSLYHDQIQHYLHRKFGVSLYPSHTVPENQLKELAKTYAGTLAYFMGSASGFVGDLMLVPLYVFFLLSYNMFFLEFLYKAFAKSRKNVLDQILKSIYVLIHSYLKGMLMVMVIVGLMNSIGLLLLDIDNAIFFGFLAAFLLLIPYIGIFIGSVLPVLVALATKDSPWYALGVIGIFGFIQI